MPFVQGKYSVDERNKNRANVLTTAAVGVIALVAIAAFRSWELGRAVGAIAMWLVACGVLFWAFCTKGAGPVDLNNESKGWFDIWRGMGRWHR